MKEDMITVKHKGAEKTGKVIQDKVFSTISTIMHHVGFSVAQTREKKKQKRRRKAS